MNSLALHIVFLASLGSALACGPSTDHPPVDNSPPHSSISATSPDVGGGGGQAPTAPSNKVGGGGNDPSKVGTSLVDFYQPDRTPTVSNDRNNPVVPNTAGISTQ